LVVQSTYAAKKGKPKMTKIKSTTPAILPKRLSPELAEVLHMLKSLETQAIAAPVAALR
jgi:CxxC motif-containing protein